MSLSAAIGTALGGLHETTRRLGVVSDNVANATTEGYAARRAEVGADAAGGPRRVRVARESDPQLTAIRRGADAEAAEARVRAEAAARLAAGVGEYGDEGTLAARANTLARALSALGDDASSAVGQRQAAEAAEALAKGFHRADAATRTAREEGDAAIGQLVATTNDDLSEIDRLNRRIARDRAAGRDVTGLEDRRDRRLDRVGAALPLRVSERADDRVEVRTLEGVLLVGHEARRLDFAPTPVIAPDASLAGGALSGLSVGGIDVTPGGTGPQAIRTGALAGHFSVRDEVAPALSADLDRAAADLIARFEAVADPTRAPGDPGLFTDAGAALDTDPDAGLAGRIAVSAAVDPDAGTAWRLRDGLGAGAPGPAGANGLIRALDAALAERRPGPDGVRADLAGRLAILGEGTSAARLAAEDAETTASTLRAEAAEAEGAALGVDSDAELARLVTLEQLYAANARVIETAGRMLDDLERLR